MTNYVTMTSDKSKKTTIILCACGGMFGVHDFYLGKIGKGIIKLCTCNWLTLGWIVDLIKIVMGSYKDNVGNPVRK